MDNHWQNHADLTSLDTLETNEQRWRPTTDAQARLHARHAIQRHAILNALHGSGDDDLEKRATRIQRCCEHPLICLRSDGSLFTALPTCKDRLCPFCQKARGLTAATKLSKYIRRMNAPRFVTLTLKHNDDPLDKVLGYLAASFKRLRRTETWKRHVTGGVYSIEVTRNQYDGRWHAHLHLIVDGSYFDQKALSAAWRHATADSDVVDIRKVHDADKSAKYLATYISKPFAVESWPPQAIAEYATAMHGRRLVHAFGTLHAADVTPEDLTPPAATHDTLISVTRLRQYYDQDDIRAVHAVAILARLDPTARFCFGFKTPAPDETRTPPTRDEIQLAIDCMRDIQDEWLGRSAPSPTPPTATKRQRQEQLRLLDTRVHDTHGRLL